MYKQDKAEKKAGLAGFFSGFKRPKKQINTIKNTIYRNVFFSVSSAAAAAVVAMLIIVSFLFGAKTSEDLKEDTTHTAMYVNTISSYDGKIDFLKSMFGDGTQERVTFIASDGTVLYDSAADYSEMENHLARPEIRQAIEMGTGEAHRSSETVGKRIYYYAVRLDDGSILRGSKPSTVFFETLIALIPACIILMAFIVIGTGIVSRHITAKIMRPIYNIDLNNINEKTIYPELLPFFKRIEAENAEKEKTEAIRREFSANVSHELKTPLTSISGYAQMITNGMAKAEDINMFGLKIEREAERLILLINDIIRLSNLDESSGIVEPEEIRLDEIVEETIAHLEPQIEKKDVKVYYSGDASVILGTRTLIGELTYNIIDNAIKYNKQGGRIDVYVGKSPGGIDFSVKDTGIGIAEEDIERIFERFYRVDKSHSKTVGGTGLGLSIVKHIAMVHGADIKVKSTLGKGTTITVTFKQES